MAENKQKVYFLSTKEIIYRIKLVMAVRGNGSRNILTNIDTMGEQK